MALPRRVLFLPFSRLALVGLLVIAVPSWANDREAQLEKLRTRIDKLQQDLNDTRERRDSTREQLRTQEQHINTLMRSLRDIDSRLQQYTQAQSDLKRRAEREREQLHEQSRALAAQLRAAHAMGQQPYIKLLLNQESPAATARALTYYRYFNEARLGRISQIETTLARVDSLDEEIEKSTTTLTALRDKQSEERQALEETRQRRTELLAGLNREVEDKTQEIARLRADEQRLERLLKELKTALAEPNVPFPTTNGRFASLKGRLPLPVAGRIEARYGDSKGVGDMRWRGIFLGGKEGQNVRAVSRGRVAYADWLKGFGLLLILDHGDGYMTLYGHNQALLRNVGDAVEAGQPIATVGNSGDAQRVGVYFEIRHNGTPDDPLQWCALGRGPRARR
ncbi:MAG: peptidoglycan DD-metalloendopeptidase family protein [Gammaproteobacteria bacterium]|nr:peptidoglycan DD-metalloendopeptidase family protein [Gammaproteobacteria bacterium]